jgi:hypothetical protein
MDDTLPSVGPYEFTVVSTVEVFVLLKMSS